MASALTLAPHLIRRGFDPSSPDESDLLCPMRLQKLLYYWQGLSLAVSETPLFSDEIEAWVHGPVVPDVFHHFKSFGANSITPESAPIVSPLTPTQRDVLEMVWREYGQYSAGRLRAMTHAERPWCEARAGLNELTKSSNHISQSTMADFFRGVLRGMVQSFDGPDPVADWQADDRSRPRRRVAVPV